MGKDLRTYLEQLRKARPDDIKVVDKEVDPKWEITAMVEKLRREQEGFPAILFNNVKGSKLPVMINLAGSYERLALAIDTDVKNMVPQYGNREGNFTEPKEVGRDEAPVQEVVWTGDDIDLNKLPIVWHNELDSGYYVDAGPSIVLDPDSGKLNAGIYRHEPRAPRPASCHPR